jgi:hypothetical protein
MFNWRILNFYKKKYNGKQKTEAKVIFLNPFTIGSLCKGKIVVCLFVHEETNRSYLFHAD